jgi:hypothetical protein
LHHLVITASTPRKVVVRKKVDGVEKTLRVLSKAHVNWQPSPDNMPVEIQPHGWSLQGMANVSLRKDTRVLP